MTRTSWAALGFAAASVLSGCGDDRPPEPAPVPPPGVDLARPYLTEATSRLPAHATTRPFPDGTFYFAEVLPGGLALFDYDNDDDLDILLLRTPVPGEKDEPAPNLLLQQQDDGSFLDVTEASGLGDPGYAVGVAVGDTDNDGFLDVYVANVGRDALYLGQADGTFVDRTEAAGFASRDEWSMAATFADYDRDGDLDLYVTHYVVFDPTITCPPAFLSKQSLDMTLNRPRRLKRFLDKPSRLFEEEQNYCGPVNYPPRRDTLYRNNGNGTFSDVTDQALIDAAGHSFTATAIDLTGDGWLDFMITNDQDANHLWVNQQDGTFLEEAVLRGLAVSSTGLEESSMGTAIGDVTGDGQLDLLLTHVPGETNTLYVGLGDGSYSDETDFSGMAPSDRSRTGWGLGFVDLDNDGDLDVAVVNGRVRGARPTPGATLSEFWNRYPEPNLLFINDGTGRFTDVSAHAGSFSTALEISRGLAFGDIDNDGDVDLATTNLDGTLRIYLGNADPENHWLQVRALTGKRDAHSALLTLRSEAGDSVRVLLPAQSYASSSDPRVHFGLGRVDAVESLTILWPDGTEETFEVPGIDRRIVCRQGGRCEDIESTSSTEPVARDAASGQS